MKNKIKQPLPAIYMASNGCFYLTPTRSGGLASSFIAEKRARSEDVTVIPLSLM